ncbi:tetratricopeptide repeat protein [candidate division KSB1 bacterium]|nr:tetratricopeptide repeat protein [candidate division KSB1 bacterium]
MATGEWLLASCRSFYCHRRTHRCPASLPEFFDQYTSLTKREPGSSFNQQNLAISYSRLGSTHSALGNLEQALGFFEERSRLGKELYDAYPNNVSFKNGLAISYIKLGSVYEKMEKNNKAVEYYRLSAELLSELAHSFPQYVEFKNNQAWVQKKFCFEPAEELRPLSWQNGLTLSDV